MKKITFFLFFLFITFEMFMFSFTYASTPLPKSVVKPNHIPSKSTVPSKKPNPTSVPKATIKPKITPNSIKNIEGTNNLLNTSKPQNAITLPQLASFPSNPTLFTDVQITNGLNVPIGIEFSPDGRIFITEKGGNIRIVKNNMLLSIPFLSIPVDDQGERGLLGFTFDPNFTTSPYVYVYYTVPGAIAHNRVSRFTVPNAMSDTVTVGSEKVLFELSDLSTALIHNGGAIHFGLDGKLYIATGENANPNNAQDLFVTHGKILRINKDGTIPIDNPFYNSAIGNNRAIWEFGHRNPFSFAIQPGSGRIFVNDVGKDTWEEINETAKGGNFGWPITEGPTAETQYEQPFYAYDHAVGRCIAGGVFYNPTTSTYPSDYTGDYFFADYESGWINRIDLATKTLSTFATGLTYPVDVDVSSNGELYYLEITGNLGKLTYTPPASTTSWQDADVGAVGQTGRSTVNGLTYTLFGSGSDIWGTNDSFHYLYRALDGDGQITARVISVQNTDPYAKAGVLFRESLSDNAMNVMMNLTALNGPEFGYRNATNTSMITTSLTGAAPYWVRLVRTGNNFKGFASADGITWSLTGDVTIPIGKLLLVGLGVTAHNNSELNSSVFDNVSIDQSSAPIISIQPTNVTVGIGQNATFRVTATGTAPLSYQWQRNGININGATNSSYVVTNPQVTDSAAKFNVLVSNGQGTVLSNGAFLTVTNNQAPVPNIDNPLATLSYKGGDTITFTGAATDPEDGVLPASAFTWQVDFQHDTHSHPILAATTGSTSGSFTIPSIGETSSNVWLRIYLTVKDSGGNSTQIYRDIQPIKSNVTLQTNPIGLQLVLDGTPVTAPNTFTGVAGITRTIKAVSPQTINGQNYEFVSWSDGLAQQHDISTPFTTNTFTANYKLVPTVSNAVTVYYKRTITTGTQYIHYRPTGGTWTTAPGIAMVTSEVPGYAKATLSIGTAMGIEAAFNVDNGNWDSRGGLNYQIPNGIQTVENNTVKTGLPSTIVSDTTPPTVPSGLTSSAKTDTSVSLSWTASTDNVAVSGYEIYRNGLKIGTSSAITYTDTGLSVANTYSYSVKAYDTANNRSAASTILNVTTNSSSTIQNSVTVYYKRIVTTGTQYIHYRPTGGTWTTAPGIAMVTSEVPGYVKSILSIGTATGIEAAFNVDNGSWDSKGGTNYIISMGIQTVENNSVKNGAPVVLVLDTTAPSIPMNIVSSSKTSTNVSLSWTASSDNIAVTSYDIYRNGTKVGSSTVSSYVDSGLTASTTYSYTIKAYDAAGNASALSSSISVITNAISTANSTTIYYKRKIASGTQYLHYRPAGGAWTVAPGIAMSTGTNGYAYVTVSIGSATGIEAVFNVNNANWDNNNNLNYKFGLGTFTLDNGVISNTSPPAPGAKVIK